MAPFPSQCCDAFDSFEGSGACQPVVGVRVMISNLESAAKVLCLVVEAFGGRFLRYDHFADVEILLPHLRCAQDGAPVLIFMQAFCALWVSRIVGVPLRAERAER